MGVPPNHPSHGLLFQASRRDLTRMMWGIVQKWENIWNMKPTRMEMNQKNGGKTGNQVDIKSHGGPATG